MSQEYSIDFLEYGDDSLVFDSGKYRAVAAQIHSHEASFQSNVLQSAVATKNITVPSIPLKPIIALETGVCPSPPTLLSKTSFCVKVSDFSILFEMIVSVLSANSFVDASYKSFVWNCRMASFGSVCDFTVSVYWNSVSLDYIVETKRLSGDGRGTLKTLFDDLQSKILGEKTSKPSKPLRRGICAPLPLALSSSGSVSSAIFLEEIQPIFVMCRSTCIDIRLEGVKMLLDLSSKSANLLENDACIEQCCDALGRLLSDEDSDNIKVMCLMTLESFLQLPRFKSELSNRSPMVECLISLIVNNLSVEPIGGALLQRRAMQCVLSLSHSHSLTVMQALASLGFCSKEQWIQQSLLLQDEHTRVLAQQFGDNIQSGLCLNQSEMSTACLLGLPTY